MDEYATALVRAVERVTPVWIERLVVNVCDRQGMELNDELILAAQRAGKRASNIAVERLTELLSLDIDEQATTPLAIMRDVSAIATEVLRDAGTVPTERDDYARRMFPDDIYDLIPATWGDIDDSLTEPGLSWGASKAMAHRARHGE